MGPRRDYGVQISQEAKKVKEEEEEILRGETVYGRGSVEEGTSRRAPSLDLAGVAVVAVAAAVAVEERSRQRSHDEAPTRHDVSIGGRSLPLYKILLQESVERATSNVTVYDNFEENSKEGRSEGRKPPPLVAETAIG